MEINGRRDKFFSCKKRGQETLKQGVSDNEQVSRKEMRLEEATKIEWLASCIVNSRVDFPMINCVRKPRWKLRNYESMFYECDSL